MHPNPEFSAFSHFHFPFPILNSKMGNAKITPLKYKKKYPPKNLFRSTRTKVTSRERYEDLNKRLGENSKNTSERWYN